MYMFGEKGCTMWKEIITKNAAEDEAKETIIQCEKRMKWCTDPEILWDLYIEADDLWKEFFEEPWEIMDVRGRTPDHERIFTARQKLLEAAVPVVAIYGDVHVTGNVYVNGKEVIHKE